MTPCIECCPVFMDHSSKIVSRKFLLALRAALIPLPFDMMFYFVCMKMYIFIFKLNHGLVLHSESTYFKLFVLQNVSFIQFLVKKKRIRTMNIYEIV